MRAITPALLVLAVLLAGCQGSAEPADPPTSQDALTTTTEAAPTTQAPPPDDVEATSSAPDDVVETTEAGGHPTLPDEANEDSEAGAEAFALHYIEALNYAAMAPVEGLIDPLASDTCATCEGFESMVNHYVEAQQRAAGPIVDVTDSRARTVGNETVVFLESVETRPATLDLDGATATASGDSTAFTMVVTLIHTDGQWMVSEIQVEQ